EKNINTISFPSTGDKKVLFKKVELEFRKSKPEYFIAYHSLDRKTGIYLKRKTNNKFINIASRQNITMSTPIIGALIYNRYFDYQIACSRGVGVSLVKSSIKKDKVKILNNCIEVPENLDKISGVEVRNSFPFSDKIVLGLSTWFHKERKGFDILFEGFSKLDERYVLLIIGIPETMQKNVLDYAKEFNIEKEKIIMPGYVENIWEYYKAMDIFLLPSRSEGFSLALLEAGAAGLPVIASDIPGNDELIKDGENGLLFEVNKPEELSGAIIKLSDIENLKEKFAKNLHKEVLSNYLISNYADKMEEFFNSIKHKEL
ncbi:MAG TPA: glycosyltransferase family 4 protein, partial [Ignavibacteriaceae bacterium]|nr:glycosyltransferase family 4 protein [Ignavibacteriaceae bacterium]